MGDEGIGPSTSVLSGQRSTTELIAQIIYLCLIRTAFPACRQAGTTELIALSRPIKPHYFHILSQNRAKINPF